MRVLHHGDRVVDRGAAAEAAARSGFPAVSLRGVGKRYGEGPAAVDALAGVDLEVWPGEFVLPVLRRLRHLDVARIVRERAL